MWRKKEESDSESFVGLVILDYKGKMKNNSPKRISVKSNVMLILIDKHFSLSYTTNIT